MLFAFVHYLPWQIRAVIIWGFIWLPSVVLSATVDYARVHGGSLGLSLKLLKRKKKKKQQEEDEDEDIYYYDQKPAWEARNEQALGDL